jgi:DNA-nicking Smr family endonuclease
MPPRARGLSEADKALWASYARQIAPLSGRKPAEPALSAEAEPVAVVPVPRAHAAVSPAKTKAAPLSVGIQPGGIDSASWQRLRTGKLATERKLDLHGMTTQRAFNALVAFLRGAHADHVRCVEVVTGRGSGETGGAIRREFPMWLNLPEIRPMILAAVHPHALNPGSVRLILRRIR